MRNAVEEPEARKDLASFTGEPWAKAAPAAGMGSACGSGVAAAGASPPRTTAPMIRRLDFELWRQRGPGLAAGLVAGELLGGWATSRGVAFISSDSNRSVSKSSSSSFSGCNGALIGGSGSEMAASNDSTVSASVSEGGWADGSTSASDRDAGGCNESSRSSKMRSSPATASFFASAVSSATSAGEASTTSTTTGDDATSTTAQSTAATAGAAKTVGREGRPRAIGRGMTTVFGCSARGRSIRENARRSHACKLSVLSSGSAWTSATGTKPSSMMSIASSTTAVRKPWIQAPSVASRPSSVTGVSPMRTASNAASLTLSNTSTAASRSVRLPSLETLKESSCSYSPSSSAVDATRLTMQPRTCLAATPATHSSKSLSATASSSSSSPSQAMVAREAAAVCGARLLWSPLMAAAAATSSSSSRSLSPKNSTSSMSASSSSSLAAAVLAAFGSCSAGLARARRTEQSAS
mmetsp:Transcript_81981/g.237729  ORF Transcript_81981/g.237729 Transcript_81981/m.237729 type:complete len:467 (-) Transcript_81981:416-1816(-)